jgi:S-adenosylmethionine:tRNA ribosyltransferase-isomerase
MEPSPHSINQYNYPLPPEKIAFYPPPHRDLAKLLVYNTGNIKTEVFKNLAQELPENTLLFLNNTQVLPARIYFETATGAAIEIFYLEPYQQEPQQAMLQGGEMNIKCFVGNAKKWKNEVLKKTLNISNQLIEIQANLVKKETEYMVVQLQWTPAHYSFYEVLQHLGTPPIPPYIKRKAEAIDHERYQTVYHQNPGSVAAPTAGLHFTPAVFESLQKKNIQIHPLTLHVGAGTFKPVQDENYKNHTMHAELVSVPLNTIKAIRDNKNKPCISVGTTSLRSLESLYWVGVKLHEKSQHALQIEQFEYEQQHASISLEQSMEAILHELETKLLETISFQTSLMICPGYPFRMADALITNFHQPKSTLLLLVSAFVGTDWEKIYDYALQHNFKFLSYGDSSLLWKNKST